MGIRNISEDVIVVTVPSERLKRSDELKNLNDAISDKLHCNVIIDFIGVEIINSWNISNLLLLKDMLEKADRKLVLCNVNTATKCIFVVAGLSETFVFADDRDAALEIIRDTNSPVTSNPK